MSAAHARKDDDTTEKAAPALAEKPAAKPDPEPEVPQRSEFATASAKWAADAAKVSFDAQDAAEKLAGSYGDLMAKAPLAVDSAAAVQAERLRTVLDEFTMAAGRVRSIAGELGAAASG